MSRFENDEQTNFSLVESVRQQIRDKHKPVSKVFVYGIFLDKGMRDEYGMSNPTYTTVPGYATFGGYIVQADKIDVEDMAEWGIDVGDLSLTGLLCDMEPYSRGTDGELINNWKRLDALEGGYDRILVETILGDMAWMYVAKQVKERGGK